MGNDEKELVISPINKSNGEEREYYYTYNLSTEKLKRINESPKDLVTLKYPDDERQNQALKALSFEAYDLRYYPNESDEVYEPFKKENLPLKEYILESDDEDTVFPPMLTLTEDNKFVFIYDMASSYLSFGQYEVDGDTYTLKTEDQDRTFVFKKEGDNLIFNEEESFDSIMSNGKKLKDGSVFTQE